MKGTFDEGGNFVGTFTIQRGDNVPQEIKIESPFSQEDEINCGNLKLQLNIYDREETSIEELFTRMGFEFPTIGIRAARQILTDISGIGIFRNGFRIRPYGEPENDWLELERLRVQDPSKNLGLSQVSGIIHIEDADKSNLIERSSREGLEHNEAFDRLKDLINTILIHCAQRRLEFREKAKISRKRSADASKAKEMASLKPISDAVAKLPEKYQKNMLKVVQRESAALSNTIDELDEYNKLLQSHVSLGRVVTQIIHEGRRILNPMSTAAKMLFDYKDRLPDQGEKGKIYRKQFPAQVRLIQDGTKSMSSLFRKLDPISGRRRGTPSAFNVFSAIENALSLFQDDISRNIIHVKIDIDKNHRAYGYVEDFQAAALNILENAIYWLSNSKQTEKNIKIHSVVARRNLRINISNNGPQIDRQYVHRLFVPGFTLKTSGTGLGLSIARETCRASKGDLVLKDVEGETCFEIIFPVHTK